MAAQGVTQAVEGDHCNPAMEGSGASRLEMVNPSKHLNMGFLDDVFGIDNPTQIERDSQRNVAA